MYLFDTRQHKDLMGPFIADLVLQILLSYHKMNTTTFTNAKPRELSSQKQEAFDSGD
jgi:hypothetical protein